uniref:RING-type domain-containing protein n=2 Tax=Guillardia theta TaxID=55529 RepID=A0A7S4UPT0_GUITH|mmetsp:Transcript_5060/g.18205  ORF Transcript_5060/g.18205 Transcript_5060/m.18205 type:complete len:557 (+) Transcript_5060:27-1697(+)
MSASDHDSDENSPNDQDNKEETELRTVHLDDEQEQAGADKSRAKNREQISRTSSRTSHIDSAQEDMADDEDSPERKQGAAPMEVEGDTVLPAEGSLEDEAMETEQSNGVEGAAVPAAAPVPRSGGRSGKQGTTELTRLGAPGAGKKSVGRRGVYPPGRPPVPNDCTSISKIPARILNAELTCPICLSIVRSTHTFMECLHRFCQECIEKYLRLGQKECPKCRVKVSSRRALRADPQFDKLIQAFYPDIDAYEEKEEEFISKVNAESHTIAAAVEEGLRRQSQAASGRSKDKDTERSSGNYVASGAASSSQNRSTSQREKPSAQLEGEEEGRKAKGDKAGGSAAKKVSSGGKSSKAEKVTSGFGAPSSSARSGKKSENGMAKVGVKRKSDLADKSSREVDGEQRKESKVSSQGRNGKKPEGPGGPGDRPAARPVSPPSPPSIVSKRQGIVEFRLWPHPTEQRVQPLKKDYVCSIESCQMIVLKKFLASRYKQEDYRAFDLLIHTTEQENALIPNDITLGTVVRMLWQRTGELKIMFRTSSFYKEIREANGALGQERQ